MIHIKLHDRRPIAPGDPMGRDWVGYDPDVVTEELFDRNRGRWALGDRAEDESYALFSFTGDHMVKFVATIDGLEDVDGKRALVGHVLDQDDPVAKEWIGQPAPDSFRNPVTYVADFSTSQPDATFTAADSEIFERYIERKPWPAGVSDEDRTHFASIRSRLEEVALWTVGAYPGSTALRAYESRVNPNGFSPQDLWMCTYPAVAPHQSYALQIAAIIRADGAEICFCLGAGWAQISDSDRRRRAEDYLVSLKAALAAVPHEMASAVEADLGDDWKLRRRWRAAPEESEFDSLSEWLEFAASDDGAGASISRYLNRSQLEELGDGFPLLLRDLAGIVAPIMDTVSMDQDDDEGDEPPYTSFEKRLDAIAEPIFEAGRPGYAWGDVDELLAGELDLDGPSRCKKAGDSGRAANVLTESNDKTIALYLVFIGPLYTREAFLTAAADRIRRFPNVETVAVADHVGAHWRVRSIIERRGVGRAEDIRTSFPAVEDEDIILVDADFEAITEPPVAPEADPEIFESAMLASAADLEGLQDLTGDLRNFAHQTGLILDVTMAADYLAAILSSQLLFFAGPSGTGKSISARLLQDFFAKGGRSQVFEARRQWLSPDDFAGYYSVLADQFATTPDTEKLIEAHTASVTPVLEDQELSGPPIFLIEEINLSPPEGYLAPVVHGLSAVSAPSISWSLHSRAFGAVDPGSVIRLPETLRLGPYPRVLGTINVDSTAHAPARKVAARACVLLLEPHALDEAELIALGHGPPLDAGPTEESASRFLGDPMTALSAAGDEVSAQLRGALLSITGKLGDGVLVSRRDALRSLAYMAYYVRLQTATAPDPETVRLAAENAILHYVLPTLGADHFTVAMEALDAADLAPAPTSEDVFGGILGPRIERLKEMTSSSGLGFADSLDFWSALS